MQEQSVRASAVPQPRNGCHGYPEGCAEEAPRDVHDLLPASSGLPQALQQQGNVAATTNLKLLYKPT